MKKYCIVNCENKKIINKLEQYGLFCIPTEKSADVSEPISLHADVLYLRTGEKELCISECQNNNINLLKSLGYKITTVKLQPGYKTESKLNVVVTDKNIVHNPKTAIDYNSFNKIVITVNQGYTKCSTIVLSDNDFITEDEGIYKTLKDNGKNCLLIKKGYVKLDGYDYGFIGGASAYMPEESTLLFFGDISKHPDYNSILAFCKLINVDVDWVGNMNLIDIGGVVKI